MLHVVCEASQFQIESASPRFSEKTTQGRGEAWEWGGDAGGGRAGGVLHSLPPPWGGGAGGGGGRGRGRRSHKILADIK